MQQTNDEQTYCGFVAIVGRPNVGKSTLLNKILGQKISITSRKPQTTRHRVMGIDTEGTHQTIYVDTPGLHSEEKRAINRLMNRAAASSLGNVEMVFFLVEGTQWTGDDEMILNKLRKSCGNTKVVAVVNKEDNVQMRADLLPHLQWLGTQYDFDHIMPISAKHGDGVPKLIELARDSLIPSDHFFPEDYITDRSQRFMASEIIREKLMRFTGDEIPYSVTVEIEAFTMQPNGVFNVSALILVEREGQKRMIIGKKGEKLKQIGREARKDMEEMFENKVFLELWVKVKSGWADDERALNSLGYGE
ncbi:GTPase Era [Psychrobium sp. 1_MG-2023]|uniref:GTPase Era n=1 Tax=Psychrobium sp. 1_MG-2023 TaxID=3062624 RepID=UPI000C332B09|nr:GTPase Era [Psychrobium sp. 1_MG-2023]MDP2560887.1 GTPase Era [Psychrobium sp. 1_MG-2023]PKF55962.1 GTPase Era [Alteromonadales bacterium alter-6D02]